VTVRVVVGVPLHDNVRHLRTALGSILAQRFDELAVVVLDDSRSDEPGRIVEHEFGGDDRLDYSRNPRHLGLVQAWRRAFERARELHPGLSYFAWGSDHDVWEPDWLARLVEVLDAHPETVLAYPLSDRIDDAGEPIRAAWRFETAGVRSRARRFATTVRRMVAGDMVYGLARADALASAGVLRNVLMPDRLLVAELALQGEFRQVPELLWHRRGTVLKRGEPARQRARGHAPSWSRLPWSLQHAAAILWNDGVRGAGRPRVGRAPSVAAAFAYLLLSPGFRAARALAGRSSTAASTSRV
jgi:glycosyltransferase involved in cell wall biosynthesis